MKPIVFLLLMATFNVQAADRLVGTVMAAERDVTFDMARCRQRWIAPNGGGLTGGRCWVTHLQDPVNLVTVGYQGSRSLPSNHQYDSGDTHVHLSANLQGFSMVVWSSADPQRYSSFSQAEPVIQEALNSSPTFGTITVPYFQVR